MHRSNHVPSDILEAGRDAPDGLGLLMECGIRYIKEKLPKAFVFENVVALTFKKHNPYFQKLLQTLQAIVDPKTGMAAYSVSFKKLNTLSFGLPQSRQRVFIVGLRIHTRKLQFKWPRGARREALTIEEILGEPERKRLKRPEVDGLAPFQIKNLSEGFDKIVARGGKPMEETWFIDIHASRSRSYVRFGSSPCLTRSRAALKGFWVTNRGGLMTTEHMLKLQGIKSGRLVRPEEDCTQKQFDAAIGNAVSVPVLKAVLAKICKSLGYLP